MIDVSPAVTLKKSSGSRSSASPHPDGTPEAEACAAAGAEPKGVSGGSGGTSVAVRVTAATSTISHRRLMGPLLRYRRASRLAPAVDDRGRRQVAAASIGATARRSRMRRGGRPRHAGRRRWPGQARQFSGDRDTGPQGPLVPLDRLAGTQLGNHFEVVVAVLGQPAHDALTYLGATACDPHATAHRPGTPPPPPPGQTDGVESRSTVDVDIMDIDK